MTAINDCGPNRNWTDEVGNNETYPMNCITWYEGFAFCAWDGGRLPTEAEWEYVAAGGSQERTYPWGNDGTGTLPANYADNHGTPFLSVGSEPLGNGRWGQSDLAGSIDEWLLDYLATFQNPCSDCARLSGGTNRVLRGGRWNSTAAALTAANRYFSAPTTRGSAIGVRCARSAP